MECRSGSVQGIRLSCFHQSWACLNSNYKQYFIMFSLHTVKGGQGSSRELMLWSAHSAKPNEARGWHMCCVVLLSVPISITLVKVSLLFISEIVLEPLVCLCGSASQSDVWNIWFEQCIKAGGSVLLRGTSLIGTLKLYDLDRSLCISKKKPALSVRS